MAGPAYIQNTDAIEATRAALAKFAHQVGDGLAEVEAEMRRMLDWLEHDRPRYWKNAVREAWDGVEQAKQSLHRCLMYPIGDERPSCTEERQALKQAEARLAYCQEKAERLKGWCRELRHELFEYEGRIAQLKEITDIDVAQSVALLGKILDRVAEYHQLKAPNSREIRGVTHFQVEQPSEVADASPNEVAGEAASNEVEPNKAEGAER
jgi:hypothetical protein